jgi:alkanesulfonate monooxygenase
LGNSGVKISSLAWGNWRFEGEVNTAAKLVNIVLAAGINFFYTADIYDFTGSSGFGDAEALLGVVMAAEPGLRQKMVIASKGGIMPPLPYDSSAAYLTSAIDASLKRLGTDYLDLWYIHRPDILTHPQEIARTRSAAVSTGKIRAVGLSNHIIAQVDALQAFLDIPIVATQPELSPFCLDTIENGELDHAMRTGMAVFAWSPLGGGRISDPQMPRDKAILAALSTVAAAQNVSIGAAAYSWEHCRNIVMAAEKTGFDNMLLLSGYQLGLDTKVFASAIAPYLRTMRLLMAVRVGEDWPPQLARRIATLDRILGGRLTVNIISSDLPGQQMDSNLRYARTVEVVKILKTMLSGQHLSHHSEHYDLELDPPRMTTVSGKCPPLYFGGLSPAARDAAAEAADVFLMWPDTMENVRTLVADMRARTAAKGLSLKFGYRAHVIGRETEDEARAYAARLLSKLDDDVGEAIRQKSLDAKTAGVSQQSDLRAAAPDDGFVEDNLWTGIGRARSGCAAAIVGNPDQVLAKLRAYQAEGMEAFILSGYPHAAECDLFARHVCRA